MDVVWFSEIKWDYLRTRKQQIIARKPDTSRILFLEPYKRFARNQYRTRAEGPVIRATIPFLKPAPAFPWRTALDRRSARWAVDLAARSRVRRILERLEIDSGGSAFIVSNIFAADIVARLPRKFLVYDCNDDHSSFPGMRSWTRAYFEKTALEADAVFASSRALLEKIIAVRGKEDGCFFLGNGVDYAHFQSAALREGRPSKPRLGYIGAIASWFDFEAVARLARERPDWEIVVVGPVLPGAQGDLSCLTMLPNLFHLQPVSYDELPGVLAQFTIGLIPFLYNDLTRGVNPNKMYEYLACGLPVVTTRFSREVAAFPEVVSAVDGPDLASACDAFIERTADARGAAELAAKAREIACRNDWNVIAGTFWSRVEEWMNRP